MKPRILVTDSLFILPHHVAQLEASGFEVSRLDKFKASEEELVDAIRGCSGYILGGIEQVTKPVIMAADQLKAICFTGSGYSEFIPAHEDATKQGIAITAAKGANAVDVAEFTIGLLLEMVRHFPLLRTRNELKGNTFCTARRLRGQTIGIIGYGRIGREVAEMCRSLGLKVLVSSRGQAESLSNGVEFTPKDEVLARSDIISVHTNKTHGIHALNSDEIAKLKDGTVVLNAAFPEAVDCEALLARIAKQEIRAAFDQKPIGDLAGYHPDYLTYSNAQAGFNTIEAIEDTSQRCTASMINLLSRENDVDVVNPTFSRFRR